MSDSSTNTNPRKKAAAARQEQLAKEKRRERMLKIVIAIVVVVVVVGIVGGAFLVSNNQKNANGPSEAPTPDASVVSPNDVDPATYGYVVNPQAPTTGVPQVQLWEDFQCPACKTFESSGSPDLLDAEAAKGTINLQMRPTIFLDARFPEAKNSSALATNAWGCAINADKALEYHRGVYEMQADYEGAGYTEQQLLDLGTKVGITGDAYSTFSDCVTTKQFWGWVGNSHQQFVDGNVGGTPSIYVNGKEIPNTGGLYGKPTELLAAIMAAGK